MGHKLLGSLTALCACMVFLCVSASAMTIYVETPDAEKLTLEVESGDSFDNIRDKLKALDSRTAQWWLSYNDIYLPNDRTLGEYNIQKESTLRLNASKEIQASTKDQLFSGVVDGAVQVVTLTANIEIEEALTVSRAVTLDLNGYVLKHKGNLNNSVIKVESGGDLTIQDSAPNAEHKFNTTNDLWVWDETSGTETVRGGIITGGTGTQNAHGIAYDGGGVCIAPSGKLTMNGGSIVGCSASGSGCQGGGVYIGTNFNSTDPKSGEFTMNGGRIIGCTAESGGGVTVDPWGKFIMNPGSEIRSCTAQTGGGGVYINVMGVGKGPGKFILAGGTIRVCKAVSNMHGRGGGVYNSGKFIMEDGTIQECSSSCDGNASSGVLNQSNSLFSMGGGSIIENSVANGGTIYADGGSITGKVTNGIGDGPGKITGNNGAVSGTSFAGEVTNNEYSTIEKGNFTGPVTNNGAITGGTFTGAVTGSGSITGATVVASVSASDALHAALSDGKNTIIRLSADIEIGKGLTVSRAVTLDLNGYVLRLKNNPDSSVIEVKDGGALTLTDSAPNTTHYYSVDPGTKLWTILSDGAGAADSIRGGIITGGSTGLGGGVRIRSGGTLTMNGGNIAGCRVNGQGGGVYVSGGGTFTMNGGTIAGCVANSDASGTQGGGVCVENGRKEDKDKNNTELARGVFTMNDGSIIGCATESGKGGSVYIMNSVSGSDYYGLFTMNGGSISDGGVSDSETCETIRNIGTFIANGGTVTNSGSGQYSYALFTSGIFKTEQGFSGTRFFGAAHIGHYIDLFDGGVFKDGSTVINDSTITGGTFCGTVTNRSGGVIAGGVFNGTVTNDRAGTITGGTFNGTVTNDGTITGGTFGQGSGICTVTFNANSGTPQPANQYLSTGSPISEPTAPTKSGYNFDGWYTDTALTDKWNFAERRVSETITLTAKWAVNSYTITYDLDGGMAEGNPDSYTIEMENITLNAPTRAGYTFTGWSGTDLTGEDNMTVTIVKGSTGNRSYTAHWRYNGGGGSSSSPSYPVSVSDKPDHGSVSVSPKNASRGDTVTITVEPDSGYVLDDLTVTDKNGNELKLTDKGNGKYTFTMPSDRVEVKASFAKEVETSPFADVATDAYYYEAVKWAVRNGITTGVGNNLFAPGQPCTRAQIVTFLWRAAGSPESKGTAAGMTDVVSGSYYEKAVAWAIENGVTTGTGEGKFVPDATCTRAQAVTFLARALNAKAASAAEFSDVPTDSYFAEAVAWAASNGVTEGVGNGLFAPDNNCTRGQIVTFLYRAYMGK